MDALTFIACQGKNTELNAISIGPIFRRKSIPDGQDYRTRNHTITEKLLLDSLTFQLPRVHPSIFLVNRLVDTALVRFDSDPCISFSISVLDNDSVDYIPMS